MSDPPEVTHRTVEFESLDGSLLVGDVAIADPVRAGAVLCHPHPQYGGSRFDRVVTALHDELPTAGIATLRFDFRAVFDDGVGERLDARAAVDELAGALGEVPLALVGYSFGAWVALGVDDERLRALVAIAPPLASMSSTPAPTVPTLVLTPAHDQFSPPATTEPIISEWRSHGARVDFEVVEMADHFLAGRTADVARRTATWLSDRRRLPSLP
jgi:alpha/beta superfamily hydrolase